MSSLRSGGLLAGLALALACAGTAWGVDPVRKGAGESRAKLTSMERKPFDLTLLSKVSDWKNGEAPTAELLAGKVTLIVTYSDWYPPARRAIAAARRLAEAHAKDGLIVLAIHHPEGWAEAAKPAAPQGATMLLGHDAKGGFREALLSAQDPNFYLIDRAGQLRFADIANESVEETTKFLLGEQQDAAASVNEREAAQRAQAQRDAARTAALNRQNDILRNIPELSFPAPSEQAYKDAKWPARPREQTGQTDTQEDRRVTLPTTAWAPRAPELKGRAQVLYFWHPAIGPTYEQMLGYADLLQRQHQRDLAVVGVLTNLQRLGVQEDESRLTDAEKARRNLTPESAMQRVNEFLTARRLDHFMVVDLAGATLQAVTPSQQIVLPFIAIVSSDGILRWWGFAGASEARGALERVLEVDPGILARRKVEAEYLRTLKTEEPAPADAPGSNAATPPGK